MLFRPKPSKDADPQERALWGELTSLGMVFPIAILMGFFLGRWIGRGLGHAEGGQWIGMVLGIATGFWELYKVTRRLDRLNPPPIPPEDGPREEDPPEEGDDRDPGA